MFEVYQEDTGGTLLPFNYRKLGRPMNTARVIDACSRCARESLDQVSAQWAQIAKPAISPPLPPSHKIIRAKVYKAHHAWTGSRSVMRGGMMGGASGSCQAVTSGNGIGIVPQAFFGR